MSEYYGLSGSEAEHVKKLADTLRLLISKKTKYSDLAVARRIGKHLAECKSILPHGKFLIWVRIECSVNPSSARGYLRLLKEVASPLNTGGLIGQRAIQMLSSKGVPASAMDEAKLYSVAGKKVTQAIARQIISKHVSLARNVGSCICSVDTWLL